MARAGLGWDMRTLAERAGVSANTINRYENGRNTPIQATLKAIQQAFQAAGVRFTERGVELPENGEGA
jgi:transcriptional regulator with XRE-family HTH domain